jgi:hypothetical protein
MWKIRSSYEAKSWGKAESGGYIWHTTGSGKTLTSFKAARLAAELDFIDKVFFVVDRKDLDYQTMKEYTNSIRNHIGMQLATKHAGSGFCTKCILRKNWRSSKTKLRELFELLIQVFLRFTKLATVAFIKNKYYLLVVYA